MRCAKNVMLFGANPEIEDVLLRQGCDGLKVYDDRKQDSMVRCRPWAAGFFLIANAPEEQFLLVCGVASTPVKRCQAVRHVEDALRGCDNWAWMNVMSGTGYHAVRSKVGKGVLLLDQTYVAPFAEIGDHAVLLPGAAVYHHSKIGPYCILVGGSRVLGRSNVREGTRVCCNAVVLPEGVIGPHATIGAGLTAKRHGPEEVCDAAQ